MFDMFKGNNLGEVQKQTKEIKMVNKDGSFDFNLSDQLYKDCKISIDCENMKSLVKQIKQFINETDKSYNEAITNAINYVNSKTDIKDYIKLLEFYNDCDKNNKKVNEEKKKRDSDRNKGLKLQALEPIKCSLTRRLQSDLEGTITNIKILTNISSSVKEFTGVTPKGQGVNTFVDISFIGVGGKTETLKDIDIDKLCIESSCTIEQSGGFVKNSRVKISTDSEKAATICE